MNTITEEELPGMHNLRDQLLTEMLSDEDLRYKLPGDNPTLGDLCLEMGRVEQSYANSFKTLKMDWQYRGSEPDAPDSVASLNAWFQSLDATLYDAVKDFSEEEIHSTLVARGDDFQLPVMVQFMIYHEATLIFYAKASTYLKALEKPFPDAWKIAIG